MINEYAIFTVGELKLEVNWNEEVTPCKKIRLIHPHGEGELDRDELMGIIMLFGNDAEQESLVQVTKKEMVLIERLLHIKAKKDLKKGEIITVPYQYSIERETYDELIKENPRQYRIVEDLSTPVHGTDEQEVKA
jgi:hypothetical protein